MAVKSENFSQAFTKRQVTTNLSPTDADLHGYNGFIKVSHPAYNFNQSNAVLAGLSELGVSGLSDMGAGDTSGAASLPLSVNPAGTLRSDARSAYLDPYISRPNLWVVTNQLATRVLFNDTVTQSGSDNSNTLHNYTFPQYVANNTFSTPSVIRRQSKSLQTLVATGVEVSRSCNDMANLHTHVI